MVLAGMATMPDRIDYLRNVVESLRPQVDTLRIYLNNFEEVPDFLLPNEAWLSRDASGDLGAEGKFFWVDDPEAIGFDHYLTVDDDIGYPPDYVQKLISASKARDDQAIVGVHGSEFLLPIEDFVSSRRTRYRFYEALESPQSVHMLGTATTLIARKAIQLTMNDFPARNTSDLQLAIAAQKQHVPMIAVAREANWLREMRAWTSEGYSIWKSTKAEGQSHAKTLLAQTAIHDWKLQPDPVKSTELNQVCCVADIS
jgi:hypothetical protein